MVYQLTLRADKKPSKTITVEAESGVDAVNIMRKRLAKEAPEYSVCDVKRAVKEDARD